MKNLKNINLSQYSVNKNGDVFSLRSNRLLYGWLNFSGYRTISLTNDDGVVLQRPVHRLIAEVFIENPENKSQVNHKDGDKLNNKLENLEWCTPRENLVHAYDTGLTKGKTSSNGIYLDGEYEEFTVDVCEDDVHVICKLISDGYRDVDIARMTPFGRRHINLLRHNKVAEYRDIVSQYSFKFKKEERMSPDLVISICERLEKGEGVLAVARDLGLNRKKIGNIKSRKTFKNISCKYKW